MFFSRKAVEGERCLTQLCTEEPQRGTLGGRMLDEHVDQPKKLLSIPGQLQRGGPPRRTGATIDTGMLRWFGLPERGGGWLDGIRRLMSRLIAGGTLLVL